MAENIPPAKHNYINNISSALYSFYLKMGQEKIIHQLPNLDSTKSSATNGIPTKFIKITTHVIAPILTKLYNICISKGVFPNFLKLSQITPNYEKGPKILCSNYRQISLLSPFRRIFEKTCLPPIYNIDMDY